MTIIQHPANHSTTEASSPTVGSAMAALLPKLPDALRSQFQQAYEDDLVFMFTTGMDAGEKVAWDAMEKAQKKTAVPSRPKLRLLIGGAM